MSAHATDALVARAITKRFGGVTALDGVTLDLRPGEIHGLIGPNGSGKTTLLNLLSGYYRPDGGDVQLDGDSLARRSVQNRPRLGIARTFQKPRLLPSLSVLDNAMLGAWREVRSGFLAAALAWPAARREERAIRAHAADLVHGIGLGHAIGRRASLLEHAEQRFLEIARALALRPRFLLLDEPAGGLTGAEIGHLAAILGAIRESGVGLLLVEHHTDFVFRVCDRVTALDRGRLIKHGRPDEVRRDAEVVRVYLGA
ncbi:ABC transporter ATP-binding protein [uncultured Methylobacterium sp.]|uniref:ABC transporter ATP-binding protein n=1 Tax=uncultured Methylobacterium sp. TaxID=157278 RepID=UPI002591FDEE|nr:ABC transporter ATP-binding protein [uncultured Methylobacterium sp.]